VFKIESMVWFFGNRCDGVCFPDLKEIASLIETGAYAREVRRIVRVVRLTLALRQKLNAPVLSAFLNFTLTQGSELHSRLSSYIPKVILETL